MFSRRRRIILNLNQNEFNPYWLKIKKMHGMKNNINVCHCHANCVDLILKLVHTEPYGEYLNYKPEL